MMRCAVFLPTPGIELTSATSSRATASASAAGRNDDRAARATFGPTPLTVMSFVKSDFSSALSKPKSDSSSSRT
jgi:hypothetical protein